MPVDLNDYGQFGRYRLIRRLSLGGMAEVYKAKSYTTHGFEKVVALKRLLPQVSESAQFVEMFLQEAQIAARLDHEHIGRIYELGREGDDFYLTMEFIYGHDLRQVLKQLKRARQVMDPWIAAWIGAKVCEALDYAWNLADEHGRALRLVHRDISPQNVMVGFDGTIKVIDFGIAKVANATVHTAAGVLKGKYAYMSPEHAESRVLDARSDIWSLGVVMHELLTGRRLFAGATVADTIDQVTTRPVPPLEGVPERMAAIVGRMLERDLDARLSSHVEALAELQAFLATSPQPITRGTVAAWMEGLFPAEKRLEADLTEQDVRLVFSAEERGEETTDMQSDVSSATQIFLADGTGQADYRAVLEELMARGHVVTGATEVLASGPAPPADGQDVQVLWDAVWSTLGVAGLTLVLLWISL